jgi:hypothetical protein
VFLAGLLSNSLCAVNGSDGTLLWSFAIQEKVSFIVYSISDLDKTN